MRKKRGRPSGLPFRFRWATSKDDKPTAEDEAVVCELTAEDIALWEATRNRGGRPADHALNQALVEVANDARRCGISLRASVKRFLKHKLDRGASPDEVSRYERRLNRQLRRLRPFAGAGESTGAVSEPGAPGTAARK
jgi:hypothetical protein